MKDFEFIAALKNIVERIVLENIEKAEIRSLLQKLECQMEWKYFPECFDNQRSFNIVGGNH